MKKPLKIKVVVVPIPYDPKRVADMFAVMAMVGRLPKQFQRPVVGR